jgi:putative phosphonate catabolism associated alcohol dehydrogenase
MSTSMSAIFEGIPGEIALRPIPIPEPRGAEILVRVLGCTLCGSDLHSFDGRRAVPVPTILGHEIVGEIVARGESSPDRDLAGNSLQIGDRVTWAIVAACGQCFYCQRDLPQKCLQSFKYGHESLRPGRELSGGLAGHCLLTPGTSLVKLPAELPLSVACPASCATATIAAALEAAEPVIHRNICVLGAGMLGLTACAMARHRGATRVVCVEPNPGRRELSLSFGATDICSPSELGAIAGAESLRHGFDAVLELSGHPTAFATAWPHLRLGGTLVLVGSVFPADPVPIALEQVVRRHLTIRGIHNYAPRHLLEAVTFLSDCHQNYPFADLVGDWLPLNSIAAAFAAAQNPAAIRIGVCPG